jgi:hypothetical protein
MYETKGVALNGARTQGSASILESRPRINPTDERGQLLRDCGDAQPQIAPNTRDCAGRFMPKTNENLA